MKILMVVGDYFPNSYGGTEVFTQLLAEELVGRNSNIEVGVLCMGKENSNELINGVKIFRRKIKTINFLNSFYPIYFINKLLHLYNPFNLNIIKDIYLTFKPDIIHIQMLRMITPIAIKIAQKMTIPVIQTLHETYSLWNFNPFVKDNIKKALSLKPPFIVNFIKDRIHKQIYNYVNTVVAPSYFALNEYRREKYFLYAKKEIIHNGIQINQNQILKFIDNKIKKLKRKNIIKFLFIGRLVIEKGILNIINVFKEIKNKNIELYIAGDGYLKNDIIKLINNDSRIKYCGFVSGNEKSELYKQTDILILPTSIFPETFGLVIIEAMSYGIPTIASKYGGTTEIIKNNKNGILIEPDSFYELKRAILSLTNKDNLLKLIKNIPKGIEKFNIINMANRYIDIYEQNIRKPE